MDWVVISVFRTDFTGQLAFVQRIEHEDTALCFTEDRAQAQCFDEGKAKALMNASHGAYAAVPIELVDRLVACTAVSVDFAGHCEVLESLHVA